MAGSSNRVWESYKWDQAEVDALRVTQQDRQALHRALLEARGVRIDLIEDGRRHDEEAA